MEEYDVSRWGGMIDGDGGFIEFVDPVGGYLSFHVFEVVLYVGTNDVIR